MAKKLELYKCEICGNIVEVNHPSTGTLSCCNQEMNLLTENTVDAALEKHVPVVKKIDGGFKVNVGIVEHPMVDNHYIEWIELISGDNVYTKFLNPGEKPEATFMIDVEDAKARAYCNIHGNWKSN